MLARLLLGTLATGLDRERALPAQGESCDEGQSYAHCGYAESTACGTKLATIECVHGAFAVTTPGC